MKKILVAPLNWGLGHATRCIPIIKALIASNFDPVIASDGNALQLLRKEFPEQESIELPSYNINYAKNLKWSLFLQLPIILKAVSQEQKVIADYIKNNTVTGIISDNRFGVRNAKVPSVYITHQLTVLSGFTTFLTSKIHQHIIKKFDECWVPDSNKTPNLSGKLSFVKSNKINIKFIGALSRFQQQNHTIENDILIILSGPEPHRSELEKKLVSAFEGYNGKVVLVQGIIEAQQTKSRKGNMTTYNYLTTDALQDEIQKSELIICRSGYSSILDLAKLNKKAFFIPTPNQTEQEYFAKYMEAQKMAPFAKQVDFKREMLEKIKNYSGLKYDNSELDSNLFNLFERE